MRLGVFGGSFDPPHVGHLLAALDAVEQLELDRLIWVPAARQPLKGDTPHGAQPEQRLAMVEATVRGFPAFQASRIEIDREGLSYTVATVEALAEEYPDAERYLVIGRDAWARFAEWHEPARIRTFVRIAVLERPSPVHERGSSGFGSRVAESRPADPTMVPDRLLESRLVQVSSTEIRERVNAGRWIRGFVRDEVAEIIESQGLYRW